MKVAHLIMAYKNPHQVETLLKRLSHPHFHLYIHLDKKIDIKDYSHLAKMENVCFIKNRKLCNWGGFSFVKAITASVKEILGRSIHYDYINLLSGQDYPLKTNEYIYRFLCENNGTNFISFEEQVGSKWWAHARSRYEKFHFTDVNIKGRYIAQKVNNISSKRNFPLSINLYGCAVASWWTISCECAQYIIDYLEENKKLVKFMRYTWGADEFFYPTLIMNSPYSKLVVNDNMRYIEWETGKSNPKILKELDLLKLQQSKALFARKFDITTDPEIFNQLDNLIKKSKNEKYQFNNVSNGM